MHYVIIYEIQRAHKYTTKSSKNELNKITLLVI